MQAYICFMFDGSLKNELYREKGYIYLKNQN